MTITATIRDKISPLLGSCISTGPLHNGGLDTLRSCKCRAFCSRSHHGLHGVLKSDDSLFISWTFPHTSTICRVRSTDRCPCIPPDKDGASLAMASLSLAGSARQSPTLVHAAVDLARSSCVGVSWCSAVVAELLVDECDCCSRSCIDSSRPVGTLNRPECTLALHCCPHSHGGARRLRVAFRRQLGLVGSSGWKVQCVPAW